jgi:membrane-associated protease RseP (regulator of RpoE activity)
MTTSNDDGANLSSRARAWFDRLSRVKKALATSAGLVITVGGVASAATAVLDLGQRLGAGGPETERVAPVETPVQEKTRVREGVRVTEVIGGSPADRAGVEVRDVVTDVNGKSIEDVDEFEEALKQTRPGDTVLVSLVRDSHRETVPVKLEPIEGTDLQLGARARDVKPDEIVYVYEKTSGLGLPIEETTAAPGTSGQDPTDDEPTTGSPESSPSVDQYAPRE